MGFPDDLKDNSSKEMSRKDFLYLSWRLVKIGAYIVVLLTLPMCRPAEEPGEPTPLPTPSLTGEPSREPEVTARPTPTPESFGAAYYVAGEEGSSLAILDQSLADEIGTVEEEVKEAFGEGVVLFAGEKGRASGFYDSETGRGAATLVPREFEIEGTVYELVEEETKLGVAVYRAEEDQKVALSTEFNFGAGLPTAVGWVQSKEGFRLAFLDGDENPVISGDTVVHTLGQIPEGGKAGVDEEGKAVIYGADDRAVFQYNPETGQWEEAGEQIVAGLSSEELNQAIEDFNNLSEDELDKLISQAPWVSYVLRDGTQTIRADPGNTADSAFKIVVETQAGTKMINSHESDINCVGSRLTYWRGVLLGYQEEAYPEDPDLTHLFVYFGTRVANGERKVIRVYLGLRGEPGQYRIYKSPGNKQSRTLKSVVSEIENADGNFVPVNLGFDTRFRTIWSGDVRKAVGAYIREYCIVTPLLDLEHPDRPAVEGTHFVGHVMFPSD